MTEVARLSCEQCKQRKLKCDKKPSCSACRASNLTCRPVQRVRLPRGRTSSTANKATTLRSKVARLESLVNSLESQVAQEGFRHSEEERSVRSQSLHPSQANRLEQSSARDFWVALSSEVVGLRETLELSDTDDEAEELRAQTHIPQQPEALAGLRLASLSSPGPHNTEPPSLSPTMRSTLLHLYQNRVDWLFKVVHWPSIMTMLERNGALGKPIPKAEIALERALYFLAICALLDSEILHYELGERATLIEQHRIATEEALSQAGLLATTDITVLQAFVLYVAAVRCSVSAASAWTLVAVAVRIGYACNLSAECARFYGSFELESRRRLWHAIGLLDSQTSFGRGTIPLLSHQDLKYPPKIIDDEQMTQHGDGIGSASGFTDMTFSNVCHQAMACQRKMVDPHFGSWRQRLEVVTAFERSINRIVDQFRDGADFRQNYARLTAQAMPATMQLLLRRPLYRNFRNAVPPSNGHDVLDIGCRVLRTGLNKARHKEFATLSWFRWPKWFALAVVLAELCSLSSGPNFEMAFAVAQQSYNDYAQSAADVNSGQLWKPIAKLMRRVQRSRETRLTANARFGLTNNFALDSTERSTDAVHGSQCLSVHSSGCSDPHPSAVSSLDNEMFSSGIIPADLGDESFIPQWDTFLNDIDEIDLLQEFL